MRKILVATLLLSFAKMYCQAPVLSLDDILRGAGGAGVRGRGGELPASPDGKWTLSEDGGQLTARPADGGAPKVLVASAEPETDVQWSKDSKHIAYASKNQIWVVSVAGGEPLRLTHDAVGPA